MAPDYHQPSASASSSTSVRGGWSAGLSGTARRVPYRCPFSRQPPLRLAGTPADWPRPLLPPTIWL